MKKQHILLSIVFGSMLAITGCGGDGEGDGTGGTNGTGATGGGGTGATGGGGGPSSSTCEAICGSSCVFGGITPGGDFGACVNLCNTEAPEFNDNCGPQMESYLDCLFANECSILSLECVDQAQDWDDCQGG